MGISNEILQLIRQFSLVQYQQLKIVMQKARFFCIFTK